MSQKHFLEKSKGKQRKQRSEKATYEPGGNIYKSLSDKRLISKIY